MPEIKNTQTAQKNSKGAARNSSRKVNIIEIDLTNSTNKVEVFKKRLTASANNIDRFPDAEIVVHFSKENGALGRGRIQKYSILQSGRNVVIAEGDKRKQDTQEALAAKKVIGSIWGKKSQWLLHRAETIAVALCCFYTSSKADGNYTDNLGISKEQFSCIFARLFPSLGNRITFEQNLKEAVNEVMATIKGVMTEGVIVDDYTVLRANDWGVALEDKNGKLVTTSWEEEDFFISFKDDLSEAIRHYIEGNISPVTTKILGVDVTVSLVSGDDKNKVTLRVGNMSETFISNDYKAMFLWVYNNRHEIIKPRFEVFSYAGLYGTDKVEDTVSIAKDVLQLNYEYVQDDLNYKVVFRNELGVTFTESSTEVINGTQFNNCRLVSLNWGDFQGWNNMPPEDMCTVDLQWRVEDGVATLVEGSTEDVKSSAAV